MSKASDGTPKVHVITIRVSKGELELMHERADERDLKMSEYILVSTIYDEQSKFVEHSKVLNNLILELSRQGNNLNQIARKLNTLAADDLTYADLSKQVEECLDVHMSLLKEIRPLFLDGRLVRLDDPKQGRCESHGDAQDG